MKLLSLLPLIGPALAAPLLPRDAPLLPRDLPPHVDPGKPVADGVPLRILPLGASITLGVASTDKNGYRQQLQKNLGANRVRFAGVKQNGTMVDHWHAGYPGYTISGIAGQADASLDQKPNVVLIHAGTNDMSAGAKEPADGAPERLGKLVDRIHDHVPEAVVFVSELIHNANAAQDARTGVFNDAIPDVVADRRKQGRKVALVDFSSITADRLVDGTHPNDATYRRMGDIWYDALHAVPKEWIKEPAGPDPHPSDPLSKKLAEPPSRGRTIVHESGSGEVYILPRIRGCLNSVVKYLDQKFTVEKVKPYPVKPSLGREQGSKW